MEKNLDHLTSEEIEPLMERLQQIEEVYSKPRTPVDFASLSFENKVFLGAICRALLKENLYEIAPFSNSEVILTPTDILRKNLYLSLIDNQVIAVSLRAICRACKN